MYWNWFHTVKEKKLDSITSSMRLNYKNRTYEIKANIIQNIYNLTNLSINSSVARLINNTLVVTMNETDIKKLLEFFQRLLR